MKRIYRYSKRQFQESMPGIYKSLDKRKTIVKYIISGGTAAAIDLILLYLFTEVLKIYYILSASLAFIIAFFISFYLQKFWTFRDNNREKMYQQMSLYLAVGVINLAINAGGMYILVEHVLPNYVVAGIEITYILSQIIMGALIAVFSFLVYRFVIFKRTKKVGFDHKFNLLIATGVYPPDIGGPATYVKLLEDKLPKDKYSVKVMSFGQVRSLPKAIRHLVYFYKLVKLAKGSNIIFAQDTVSVGLPAMIIAKIYRKKYIIRIAGDHAWEQARQRYEVKDNIEEFQEKKYSFKVEIFKKIRNTVANSADTIITPSHYFKEIVSKWINNPDKIKVIYNGIETEKIQERIVNDESRKNIILSAGRLVPWKGFSALIEIIKELDNWRLVIAGDGPDKEKLENKIKELALENRVELTGSIKRSELIDYLFKAKIFILNTEFESFSFQVVEAMAAQVPVITTRVCNLEEIIINNKEGVLVEPDNKREIKDAINKLTTDIEFRKMIINNAREKSKMFSIDNTVNNLDKLITKL